MISIILINYNNSYHTINCIKSLQNQTYQNFEIIIVDNNSKEYFRNKLKKFLLVNQSNNDFFKKINFIQSNRNKGFSGGNNLGIRNSKGDLILLLNSDTFHEPLFLEMMQDFFQKYKYIHIAQPKICFYPKKDIIWCNGGKIKKFSFNFFTSLNYKEKESYLTEKPFKIDYAAGCALFIKREVLIKIGLLDEIYFMYGEESDLCYRAKINGYKNIYCNPLTRIYHNVSTKYSPAFKKYYFRNRNIFCFKFFSLPIIIWQFLMQFIQLFIVTTNFNEKKIDYNFFFKSIIGIIGGLKIGFLKRYS